MTIRVGIKAIRSSALARLAAPVLVALLAAASAAQIPASADAQGAVAALRALRGEEPPTESEVEQLLVDGADACAELSVELLARRRVPALDEEQSEQTLSIQQEGILLDALERMPPRRVRPLIESRLLTDDGEQARIAALRVVGRVGDADDVSILLERALPDPAAPLPRELRDAFRAGLVDLLAEDRTAEELRHRWRDLPDALREACIRAIGDARDPRALPLLTDILERDESLRGLAVSQVRLIGRSLDQTLNERLVEALVACLTDESDSIAESACYALGDLRAEPAIEILITRLEDPAPTRRSAALWSLERIAGERLPPRPRLWRLWYERELRDAGASIEGLRVALADGGAIAIRAALRDASRLRIRRHDATHALLPALDHGEAEIRATACRALTELDSPLAVPGLLFALDDSDDRVHEAALGGLRSICGTPEAETPRSWRDWIEARTDFY